MRHLLKFLIILFVFPAAVISQDLNVAKVEINDKDTLPSFDLPEVLIFTKREFVDHNDRWEFEKLKYNTKKVYPYVEMAVEIYDGIKEDVAQIDRRRKKKKYVKEREKELRAEFEEEVRSLTRTQGNILIKLINRETGNNCYQIVKDLKGPFTAFFWNFIGKFYDHNLKEEYIPEENPDLEFIVRMLKNES